MKILIKKICQFLILLVVTLVLLSIITKNMFIEKIQNPEHFNLHGDINTLILGDSQAQFAFNPEYIHNSVNAAIVAEPLFYTFYKLKFIYQKNRQLKNIILSTSPHNLSEFNEEKLFDSEDLMHFYDQYYMLLNKNGKSVIRKWNQPFIISSIKFDYGIPLELYKNLHLWIKIACSKQQPSDYAFWGGYDTRIRTDIQMKRIQWIIAKHYYNGDRIAPKSEIMLQSLKKIAAFCHKNRLQLWLVTPPLHETYRERIPAFYRKLLKETTHDLSSSPGVHYADYSTLQLPDSFFYDCDHLNTRGANAFSHIINTLLQ
ncbi:hypothetical protein GF407_16895 [candidate division KSB1 bacterium]|nr:hypothetical protein [candidate division KSB1 bacterium]